MNDLSSFLDLNADDDGIEIVDVKTDNVTNIKHIVIQKSKHLQYCPLCNSRMYSKGFQTRKVNHPILQNGYKLILLVKQRKYRCTNPNCNYYLNEKFLFLPKYWQSTDVTPYLILKELKNIQTTVAEVARRYNVSDTYVHQVVAEYLDPKPLELPEILSVDEVFLDVCKDARYCLVLMDFKTGEIVDILPNRYQDTMSDYFLSIPYEARKKVKYISCDMYNPYINYTVNYFHEATIILDSFHVVQWLIQRINQYINEVQKKYVERDKKRLEQKNYENNTDFKTTKTSKEVYLLRNFRWFVLSNTNTIEYKEYSRHYNKLNMSLNTRQLEKMFLDLDTNFKYLRDEKQLYLDFNSEFPKSEDDVISQLNELIEHYEKSELILFRDFSKLLSKHKVEIITSFTKVPVNGDHIEQTYRRISNGPMEGFNRKPKDMKRNARGYLNFSHIRNRILWSMRKDEKVLITPKREKEIHNTTGKTRGNYKKKA